MRKGFAGAMPPAGTPSTSSGAAASSDHPEELGFGRYPNVNQFVRSLRKKLTGIVEASQTIPQGEMNYLICSTYPDFEERASAATIHIAQMLKKLSIYHGVPSVTHRLFDSPSNKASVLQGIQETTKQFKERMDLTMDELARVKEENASVSEQASAKFPVAGALLKGNQKFPTKTPSVPRPQVVHGWIIDNSDKPFVPKLQTKHNALRSLDYSMKGWRDGGEAPHPYEFELDVFQPGPNAQIMKEPQSAPSPDDTPFVYVDTTEALYGMLKELRSVKEIAADLEHHSYRTYLGITCLVQISSRSKDYIIDAIAIRNHMHELNDIFTNSEILKVFHGADSDVLWLQRDFGIYVVNMFDTGQAARALGFSRYSLSHLMSRYLGKTVDKTHQLSDWRIRALPDDMLEYARSDTHDLLYIYDCIRNELLTKDPSKRMLLDVYSKSKEICLKRYEKTKLDENDFALVMWKFAKNFSEQQKFALKRILEWRDQVARDVDESLGYVLPTKACIDIAESLPKSSEDLVRCVEFVPPVLKQRMQHILNIAKDARNFTGVVPMPVGAQVRMEEQPEEVIERPVSRPLTVTEFARLHLDEQPSLRDLELIYDCRTPKVVHNPEWDLFRQIWEYSLTVKATEKVDTQPAEPSVLYVPASTPKPLPVIDVADIASKKKDKRLRHIDQAAVDVIAQTGKLTVAQGDEPVIVAEVKKPATAAQKPRVEKRKSPLIVHPADADELASKRVAFDYQNADYSKFTLPAKPTGKEQKVNRQGGGVRDPNKSFNKQRNISSTFPAKMSSRGGFRKPE